jgi:hypothetical protein
MVIAAISLLLWRFGFEKLAGHPGANVIDDFAVLVLRAEQNDFGIFIGSHGVSGRPVKEVAGTDYFLLVRKGHGEFSLQKVSPVWRLTTVALKPFQQRRNVRAGAQRKIFCAHLSESGRISKISLLPSHRARRVDSDRNIIFRYSHLSLLALKYIKAGKAYPETVIADITFCR